MRQSLGGGCSRRVRGVTRLMGWRSGSPPSPPFTQSTSGIVLLFVSILISLYQVCCPGAGLPRRRLPPAATDRVQGYLGSALLMDLRCLSRTAAVWCEDAALQYMNHHMGLHSTPIRLRTNRFCFDHSDAVWYRQQLSRWRFSGGRVAVEEAERCTVGLEDAHSAYGIEHWQTKLGDPSRIRSNICRCTSSSSSPGI